MSKVLCIEDSATQRGAIADRLSEAGYEVIEATDGKDGLTAIVEHEPDVVLCDIDMPMMTGHDLVAKLREKHSKYAETPFVFLTASTEREDAVAGMTLGAVDYLTKPVDFELLVQTIEARLRLARRMKDPNQDEMVRLFGAPAPEDSSDDGSLTGSNFAALPREAESPASVPESLGSDRARFAAFARMATDLCMEIDTFGTVLFAYGGGEAFSRRSPSELVGTNVLESVAEQDRRAVEEILATWRRDSRLGPLSVRLVGAPDQDPVPATMCGLRAKEGDDRAYLTFSRVGGRPSEDGVILRRDPRSGLFDKASFAEVAKRKLMATPSSEAEYELTLLEIDGFREATEREVSDSTEAFVANAGAYLRSASVGGDSAGRIEDDKYGVIHDASVTTESLLDQVSRLVEISGLDKVGVSVYSAAVDLATEGLDESETAKALDYTINKFAETTVSRFTISSLSQGLKDFVNDTVTRISDLKQTVAARAYSVHYQPIVDLRTRKLHHYEALVRMADGSSPLETVTFAEEVGLVEELDLAVCQNVLDQLIVASTSLGRVDVAINLSAKSLENPVFVTVLRELLRPHDSLREQILFELTETARVRNYEVVDKVLRQLREDGHGICLDDFGAGETNLNYLRVFHVDYVKIDGAYVRNLCTESRDRYFVKSIADLCRNLGVATVAEMIEDENQAVEATRLGVDLGQGYLFGRPAPDFAPPAARNSPDTS